MYLRPYDRHFKIITRTIQILIVLICIVLPAKADITITTSGSISDSPASGENVLFSGFNGTLRLTQDAAADAGTLTLNLGCDDNTITDDGTGDYSYTASSTTLQDSSTIIFSNNGNVTLNSVTADGDNTITLSNTNSILTMNGNNINTLEVISDGDNTLRANNDLGIKHLYLDQNCQNLILDADSGDISVYHAELSRGIVNIRNGTLTLTGNNDIDLGGISADQSTQTINVNSTSTVKMLNYYPAINNIGCLVLNVSGADSIIETTGYLGAKGLNINADTHIKSTGGKFELSNTPHLATGTTIADNTTLTLTATNQINLRDINPIGTASIIINDDSSAGVNNLLIYNITDQGSGFTLTLDNRDDTQLDINEVTVNDNNTATINFLSGRSEISTINTNSTGNLNVDVASGATLITDPSSDTTI